MSSGNIDLNKFLSEPNDVIKRLYQETELGILSKEEFDNLPLNEQYLANKKKREEEQVRKVEESLPENSSEK